MKYDSASGKWVGANASGGAGSQTLDDTLGLGNTSSLGMSVGVVTATQGAVITGVVTATSYQGDGSALTGIAATDTIAAASLTVSGISTLSNTKLGIGKSLNYGNVQKAFVSDHAVGVGTTTGTGRNAGIGTAIGTVIFNTDDQGSLQVYHGDSFGWDRDWETNAF